MNCTKYMIKKLFNKKHTANKCKNNVTNFSLRKQNYI